MIPAALQPVLRRLPGWGKAVARAIWHAFWAWYKELSLVPMFIVTCIVGVVVYVALGSVPLPASTHRELRDFVAALLTLALLLVLLVGLFRSGRRR